MSIALRRTPKSHRGFSLVEVMVGLTIGLVLMATLSVLLVRNTSTRAELDKSMQQIENGRYAIELLRSELRLAGYFGPSYSFGAAAAIPVPCTDLTAANAVALRDALPIAVQGYVQPGANPLGGCALNSGNFTPGNDVLVVRRAQTSTITPAAAALNTSVLYVQANGEQQIVNVGGSTFNLPDTSGTAPLRQYVVNIYFVSPCDVPSSGTTCDAAADGGTPVPTLKRLEWNGGAWAITSIAQGVERFHVEYGVDNDSDGTPDAYVNDPGTATAWSNVVAVRLYVLARNPKTTVGHTDSKTYNFNLMVPSTYAPGDGFKRHLFVETVRLINVSGRRET